MTTYSVLGVPLVLSTTIRLGISCPEAAALTRGYILLQSLAELAEAYHADVCK